MKILFELKEIAKAKLYHGVAQRVTLEPVADPGDATVDGYAARQLQVVITNPADFIPATVNPGEVVSISLRVYDPADE